jgi:acyl-CoA thioesterase
VPAEQIERADPQNLPTWVGLYDMRFTEGSFSGGHVEVGPSSTSTLWVRDAAARPLDFPAIAALSDVFFPRVYLRRGLVPSGTISLTTYFHVGQQQLDELGTDYLLGTAQANSFQRGFFDQSAQLWSPDGSLVATTYQIVYFKG